MNATDTPFTTCDLYDQYGEAARVLGSVLLAFGGRTRFAGTAVTLKCFEDNSLIKQIVTERGTGKVLVVDGGGSLRCALIGDMIAKDAVRSGWEGVVIDGSVRDRAALAMLPIGILARGSTPRKSVKRGEGQTEIEIQVCAVTIRPGDEIFADEDGVVILPASSA